MAHLNKIRPKKKQETPVKKKKKEEKVVKKKKAVAKNVKKKVVKPNRLEHSLKALALREKKTFVLDSPTFRDSEWNVYLDLEGLTDESFWYLIGLIGINNKSGERIERSFWADKQEDTKETFSMFSETISALKDFIVFHYGNYEIKALKNINRQLNGEYDVFLATIMKNSVNILSYFSTGINDSFQFCYHAVKLFEEYIDIQSKITHFILRINIYPYREIT